MTAVAGPAPDTGAGRPSRRGVVVGVAALVVVVVLLAALADTHTAPPADDPASTAPDGAKGLALLIGDLGGVVDTTGALPAPGTGLALVLADHLSPAGRRRVAAWVRAGGTLVIADPTSDLAGVAPAEGPTPDSGVSSPGPTAPGCGAAWVAGVDAIDVPDVDLLARPPGAVAACFGTGVAGPGAGWFAVETRLGAGSVVALAGPGIWTNAHLGDLADSVLAADLLVPRDGARVAWLTGTAGGGDQTLLDVVPDRVDELLVGGLLAVVVLAAWRARRLGRPVDEPVPVVIPGSELVVATGRLLGRNGQRARAAELLREGATRDLAAHLTAAPATGRRPLAHRLAEVTGRDPVAVEAILDGPPPADDAGLVVLADDIDRLRQEVARDR